MDKKITEDLLAVDLQDYYHALNKRDKGKLLHYLMDVSVSAMQPFF